MEQFGRLVGIGEAMVSLIERGLRNPSPEVRAAIVRELRLPEEYLFPGEPVAEAEAV